MPSIAIQVIFTNSSVYLPMILRSLKAQTYSDWSLYVFDNSRREEERQTIQSLLAASGCPFTFIYADRPDYGPYPNAGFSAHNQLLNLHHADYVLLLNDDAYLEPDYLAAAVARFAADASCASVVGPVYRWTKGPEAPEVLGPETLIDTLGLEYHCLGHVVDRGAGEARRQYASEIETAHQLYGGSGAVVMYDRKKILQASPEGTLFEPHFWMYKEDVDLALRLRGAGFTSWFEPRAVSFHRRSIKAPKSISAWQRARLERQRPAFLRKTMYRNQWWLYAYFLRSGMGWQDLWRTVALELQRSAALFVLGSPWLFFSAWFEIIRSLPRCLQRRKRLIKMGLYQHL